MISRHIEREKTIQISHLLMTRLTPSCGHLSQVHQQLGHGLTSSRLTPSYTWTLVWTRLCLAFLCPSYVWHEPNIADSIVCHLGLSSLGYSNPNIFILSLKR